LAQGILCLFLVAFCHDWAIFLFFTGYVLSGPVMVVVHHARRKGLLGKSAAEKTPPS
jgi:hypothetical protein